MKLRKNSAEFTKESNTYHQKVGKDTVSWSDLDKAAVYTLLVLIFIVVMIGLALVIMLYQDRFSIATEYEEAFIEYMMHTLF